MIQFLGLIMLDWRIFDEASGLDPFPPTHQVKAC